MEEATVDMFKGVPINITENRSVLHVALRNRHYANWNGEKKGLPKPEFIVNGKDVTPDVDAVLKHIEAFTEEVEISGNFKLELQQNYLVLGLKDQPLLLIFCMRRIRRLRFSTYNETSGYDFLKVFPHIPGHTSWVRRLLKT